MSFFSFQTSKCFNLPRTIHSQYKTLRWLLETLFKALNNQAEPNKQLHFANELHKVETKGDISKHSVIIFFAHQTTLILASPFALRRFLFAPSEITPNPPVSDSLDLPFQWIIHPENHPHWNSPSLFYVFESIFMLFLINLLYIDL